MQRRIMKAVIFDLDGTLLDSMGIWRHAGEIYLRSFGIEAEPGMSDEILKLTIRGGAEYIIKRYGLPVMPEEAVRGINGVMERAYAHDILPKEGALELIKELERRGIPMAVATATDRYLVDIALRRFDMAHCFAGIVTCTEVGVGKRDGADVYEAALKFIGAQKADCWVFEDSPHAALTALKAGFKVAGVKDIGGGNDQAELKADSSIYLESLSPAAAVLSALEKYENK